MESAFQWLGKLAEWLGAFVPRWVILDATRGAIKYKYGRPVYCEPGRIHFYWPVVSDWETYPVARQVDRLETQTIETIDGKPFFVAGIITYSVSDLMALLPTTYEPAHVVIELAASALHDICCEYTWEELQAKQRKGTLKTELRNEAQKQLQDFGVRVIKMQLTSLARCRVYKVSQSTSNEET